jgi:hypothetical protein
LFRRRPIQVRVRDISFEQVAADHGMNPASMNQRYRAEWENQRGKLVTILTPHLSHPKETCRASGRVWLTKGTL